MFCRQCGVPYANDEPKCLKCNTKRGKGQRFCTFCGAKMSCNDVLCPVCKKDNVVNQESRIKNPSNADKTENTFVERITQKESIKKDFKPDNSTDYDKKQESSSHLPAKSEIELILDNKSGIAPEQNVKAASESKAEHVFKSDIKLKKKSENAELILKKDTIVSEEQAKQVKKEDEAKKAIEIVKGNTLLEEIAMRGNTRNDVVEKVISEYLGKEYIPQNKNLLKIQDNDSVDEIEKVKDSKNKTLKIGEPSEESVSEKEPVNEEKTDEPSKKKKSKKTSLFKKLFTKRSTVETDSVQTQKENAVEKILESTDEKAIEDTDENAKKESDVIDKSVNKSETKESARSKAEETSRLKSEAKRRAIEEAKEEAKRKKEIKEQRRAEKKELKSLKKAEHEEKKRARAEEKAKKNTPVIKEVFEESEENSVPEEEPSASEPVEKQPKKSNHGFEKNLVREIEPDIEEEEDNFESELKSESDFEHESGEPDILDNVDIETDDEPPERSEHESDINDDDDDDEIAHSHKGREKTEKRTQPRMYYPEKNQSIDFPSMRNMREKNKFKGHPTSIDDLDAIYIGPDANAQNTDVDKRRKKDVDKYDDKSRKSWHTKDTLSAVALGLALLWCVSDVPEAYAYVALATIFAIAGTGKKSKTKLAEAAVILIIVGIFIKVVMSVLDTPWADKMAEKIKELIEKYKFW